MPTLQQCLPVLLSAVAVFVVSSVIHMLSPWHKGDFPRVANQDQIMDALRPLAIPPGDYFMPRPASRADMRSAEFGEQMTRGPVVLMTVFPNGVMSMGRSLGLWFAYCLLVNAIAAHLSAEALPEGADGHLVFHTVGLSAFLGYAAALWQMSIWYRRSWGMTIKATIDGLIYASITAAIIMWMW